MTNECNDSALREQIQHLKEAGVTDLNAVLVSDDSATYEHTLEFLAGELQ